MKPALVTAALTIAWHVMASGIFCYGIGHPALWTFPYGQQWWEAAFALPQMFWAPRLSGFSHWPLLWFIAATIAPSLLIAIIVRLIIRRRRPSGMPALYGTTGFATSPSEMAAGGIRTERR